MKKTFTLLMGLAACAQASQVTFEGLGTTADNGAIVNTNGVITPNKGNHMYTAYYDSMVDAWSMRAVGGIAFTMNPVALQKLSDSTVVFTAKTAKDTVSYTLGDFRSALTSPNGALAIITNGSAVSIFNENGLSSRNDSALSGTLSGAVEYTLNPDAIYAATCYFNRGGSELFDIYYGPDYPGDAAMAESLIAATPKTEGYDVVPEPATATLSLLALAGLAARRRR